MSSKNHYFYTGCRTPSGTIQPHSMPWAGIPGVDAPQRASRQCCPILSVCSTSAEEARPRVRARHARQAAATRGGRPARACAHSGPGIATCANVPPGPRAARLSGVRNRPRLRGRARRPFCAPKRAALSVPIWMCRRAMLRAPATRTTPCRCSWATGAPSSSEPDVCARHARQAAAIRGGKPARACARDMHARQRQFVAEDPPARVRTANPGSPPVPTSRQALRRQEPSPAAGAGAPAILCAEARRTVGPHMDVPQGDAPRSGDADHAARVLLGDRRAVVE